MRELHHVGGRAGGDDEVEEAGNKLNQRGTQRRRRLEKREEAELVHVDEQFEVRIWCLY